MMEAYLMSRRRVEIYVLKFVNPLLSNLGYYWDICLALMQ